jgi:hypothetical protein
MPLSNNELDERITHYKRLIYLTFEKYKAQAEAECEPYSDEIERLEQLRCQQLVED